MSSPAIEFRPYEQDFARDPYPVYARLREDSPVFHSEELGLTLFCRYHDIRRLLLDRRLGRGPDRPSARWDHLPNYRRYVQSNLLETDGPEHSRLRALVMPALNPMRIAGLRDRIQGVVDELLSHVAQAGQADFITELAVPLPVYMIAELIGWPSGQRDHLRGWSAAIVRLYEKDYTDEDERLAEAASGEFAAALLELLHRRRANPREDFISALATTEGLTHDQVVATCMLLLNAGHEATVNAAGNGLLALLRNPRQLRRLREDPALLKSAVEEMLRYDAPLQLFHRYVYEDVDLGHVELRGGDKVGLLYGSANRDPAIFPEPDAFDVARQPNRHLSFGAGSHFCLGASLARLELEILIGTLIERLPGLELLDEQPRYRTGLVFRGLEGLRIAWDAGARRLR